MGLEEAYSGLYLILYIHSPVDQLMESTCIYIELRVRVLNVGVHVVMSKV